jgi:hypothetical protein
LDAVQKEKKSATRVKNVSGQKSAYLLQDANLFRGQGQAHQIQTPVLEFIDPVFAKINPKRSFSDIKSERLALIFANSGTGVTPLFH